MPASIIRRALVTALALAATSAAASAQQFTINQDVKVSRQQFSAGWFITPTIMLKGEYVNQKHDDFPTWDIRHNGKFNGFVVEGVVAF